MIIKVSPFFTKSKSFKAAAAEIEEIPVIVLVIISAWLFFINLKILEELANSDVFVCELVWERLFYTKELSINDWAFSAFTPS